jgi:hypothetical protein
MTIDEAINVVEIEIDIVKEHRDLSPYDVLRTCEHLLNAVKLLRKEQLRVEAECKRNQTG